MKYFKFTMTYENGDVFTSTMRARNRAYADATAAIMRADHGMKSVAVEEVTA